MACLDSGLSYWHTPRAGVVAEALDILAVVRRSCIQ